MSDNDLAVVSATLAIAPDVADCGICTTFVDPA